MRRMPALLIAATLAPASAMAATLEIVTGAVLVNRGNGYMTIHGPAALSRGHSVIAKSGGSAQLVYDNGCIVEVKPGAVVVVHDDAPCAASAPNVSSIPHMLATQAAVSLIVRRKSPPNPVSP